MKIKRIRKDALIGFKINSKMFKEIQDAADKYAQGNVSMFIRQAIKYYLNNKAEL